MNRVRDEFVHTIGTGKFTAVVGRKSDPYQKKLLLFQVVDSLGVLYRHHCWVANCRRMRRIHQGTLIEFEAEFTEYKSSEGWKSGIQKLRKIKEVGR